MERFVVKINRVEKKDDEKFYMIVDVYVNGVKVGEAENEFSVFQGIMVSKFQEAMYKSHIYNLQKATQVALNDDLPA